jgi:hypothetical protein
VFTIRVVSFLAIKPLFTRAARRLTYDYPGSCLSAILDNVSVLKFIFHPFLTATEFCTNAPIGNAIQDKYSEGITFVGLGALYKTFL